MIFIFIEDVVKHHHEVVTHTLSTVTTYDTVQLTMPILTLQNSADNDSGIEKFNVLKPDYVTSMMLFCTVRIIMFCKSTSALLL